MRQGKPLGKWCLRPVNVEQNARTIRIEHATHGKCVEYFTRLTIHRIERDECGFCSKLAFHIHEIDDLDLRSFLAQHSDSPDDGGMLRFLIEHVRSLCAFAAYASQNGKRVRFRGSRGE